jgi:ElaA protein
VIRRLTDEHLGSSSGTELDPSTLYELLRLRAEVFIVEQAAPYLDLDGLDLDASTRHLWIAEGGRIVAALRIVREPGGDWRIGRVVTARDARGRGHAGRLMAQALAEIGDAPIVVHAQAYLKKWYRKLGFEPTGPVFVEDGIDHVPMRRTPTARP